MFVICEPLTSFLWAVNQVNEVYYFNFYNEPGFQEVKPGY